MRYLMAKRLLADLSVLVFQLHPFCAASASASASASSSSPWAARAASPADGAARRHGPIAVGNKKRGAPSSSLSPPPPPPSSPPRKSAAGAQLPLVVPPGSNGTAVSPRTDPLLPCSLRSPGASLSYSSPRPKPVLVLRRKATTAGSPQSNSQSPAPLLQLAGRAVELIEAVAFHTVASSAPPAAAGADGAPPLVEATPAASRNHPTQASTVAGASEVCRRVEELRCGSLGSSAIGVPTFLLSRGGGARTAGGLSPGVGGVSRAVGSLISLLAAMVGAEEDLEKRRRPNIRQIPCASPQSQVPGRPGGGRRHGHGEIVAKPATVRLSEGLQRLAGVVLHAANRVCFVDLTAMQVRGVGLKVRGQRARL